MSLSAHHQMHHQYHHQIARHRGQERSRHQAMHHIALTDRPHAQQRLAQARQALTATLRQAHSDLPDLRIYSQAQSRLHLLCVSGVQRTDHLATAQSGHQ